MTDKKFEASRAKQHEAETAFKKESQAFKALVKAASIKFHAADKARAKARADFRQATKEKQAADDTAQIEANKIKAGE